MAAGQLEQHRDPGRVVVGAGVDHALVAGPHVGPAATEVVEVGQDQHRLVGQRRIAPGEPAHQVDQASSAARARRRSSSSSGGSRRRRRAGGRSRELRLRPRRWRRRARASRGRAPRCRSSDSRITDELEVGGVEDRAAARRAAGATAARSGGSSPSAERCAPGASQAAATCPLATFSGSSPAKRQVGVPGVVGQLAGQARERPRPGRRRPSRWPPPGRRAARDQHQRVVAAPRGSPPRGARPAPSSATPCSASRPASSRREAVAPAQDPGGRLRHRGELAVERDPRAGRASPRPRPARARPPARPQAPPPAARRAARPRRSTVDSAGGTSSGSSRRITSKAGSTSRRSGRAGHGISTTQSRLAGPGLDPQRLGPALDGHRHRHGEGEGLSGLGLPEGERDLVHGSSGFPTAALRPPAISSWGAPARLVQAAKNGRQSPPVSASDGRRRGRRRTPAGTCAREEARQSP